MRGSSGCGCDADSRGAEPPACSIRAAGVDCAGAAGSAAGACGSGSGCGGARILARERVLVLLVAGALGERRDRRGGGGGEDGDGGEHGQAAALRHDGAP